jgi:hypothetical protein
LSTLKIITVEFNEKQYQVRYCYEDKKGFTRMVVEGKHEELRRFSDTCDELPFDFKYSSEI